MGREENFGKNAGKGDFRENPQNINRKGTNPSIKNQLKELLFNEGELPIPADQLIKEKTIDGKKYFVFKIPTQNALALRLLSLGMSKNTNGFNALKLLLETFDGKAKQEVEQTIISKEPTEAEIDARIKELTKKDKKKC